MEQRLKFRIAFIAILVVAAGVFFYMKLDFEPASWVMGGILAFAIFFIWTTNDKIKQRQKWLDNPIPPNVNEFDNFFWDLTINQQNWYLSNIYSKNEVISLINQYEEKIKELWRDSTEDLYDRIRDAQDIEEKILTLMYFVDFYGDEEGDPEDID